MKKLTKFLLTLLCVSVFAIPVMFGACEETVNPPDEGKTENPPVTETVDYASQLKLDLNSSTKKQEVTVKLYIDGDTTHFDPVTNSNLTDYNAADFSRTQGYIKARYLAINTPESTGKIEKWGKTASNFTHDKLASAQSIIVESDTENWDIDSTGERYLLWIWYKPAGESDYKNLNIEILQNGLALASSTANNRYGTIAVKALDQAKAQQLHLYSPPGTVDENYYDGAAIPITLKELRCHITDYLQTDVRVEGVVTAKFSNSVYIEEKDEETGLYFGMAVYYGFQTGSIVEVLSIGNRVSVCGSVSEFQGTYQISGVESNEFRPGPSDTVVISSGNSAAFAETSAKDLISGKISVHFESENEEGEIEVETVDLDYGKAIMNSSVTVSNLKVVSIYTTNNGGKSDGAMSITCQAEDGTKIVIRTEVLTENGKVVTQDRYEGKVITVKGLVDYYNGSYQVAVHRADYITIVK